MVKTSYLITLRKAIIILLKFLTALSPFLKNNIEIKDGCKFDKIIRENLWEFQYAFKYVHQTVTIVNKD